MKFEDYLPNLEERDNKNENYYEGFGGLENDENEIIMICYDSEKLGFGGYSPEIYRVKNTNNQYQYEKIEDEESLKEMEEFLKSVIGSGSIKDEIDTQNYERSGFDPELDEIMDVAENSNVYITPLPTEVTEDGKGNFQVMNVRGATDGYKNILLDCFNNTEEMAKTFYHEIAHNIFGESEEIAEDKSERWYQKYGNEVLSALDPQYGRRSHSLS
ncbi:MAG: hypothetical protein ABEK36_05850 [Candidatus Aenigmatarchaeota archaeon]